MYSCISKEKDNSFRFFIPSRLTDYDMTLLRTLLYHLALVGLADRHGKEWNFFKLHSAIRLVAKRWDN